MYEGAILANLRSNSRVDVNIITGLPRGHTYGILHRQRSSTSFTAPSSVIAAEAPSGAGVKVREWPGVHTVKVRGPSHDKEHPASVDGRMFTCTVSLPMPDGTARSYAAAEQRARDLTWTPTLLDASDTLFDKSPAKPVSKVDYVYACGQEYCTASQGETRIGVQRRVGSIS